MFLSVRHNRWGIWWRSKEHDDQSFFYCFIFSFSRFFWCCVSFYRSTFWYITNKNQRRQAASSARTELSPVFGSIFYVLFCIFFFCTQNAVRCDAIKRRDAKDWKIRCCCWYIYMVGHGRISPMPLNACTKTGESHNRMPIKRCWVRTRMLL